jgi:hypothetical protein
VEIAILLMILANVWVFALTNGRTFTKISKIERYGQKQMLSLNNGEQIRISLTGYKILKEKLKL